MSRTPGAGGDAEIGGGCGAIGPWGISRWDCVGTLVAGAPLDRRSIVSLSVTGSRPAERRNTRGVNRCYWTVKATEPGLAGGFVKSARSYGEQGQGKATVSGIRVDGEVLPGAPKTRGLL